MGKNSKTPTHTDHTLGNNTKFNQNIEATNPKKKVHLYQIGLDSAGYIDDTQISSIDN